ncbi:MAG: hypothetical protein HYV03_08525, partial [Deltaproteobacteria bacterium]|nr:hypothetical protein [Deltaproteobacteria bacterium]
GAYHQRMNIKRFRKVGAIAKETAEWFHLSGSADAGELLIAWGSCAGVAKEYAAGHQGTALFIPEIIHPFPAAALKQACAGRKRVTVLEMNYQGQLYHHLRAIGAIPPTAISVARSGGLPLQTTDIEQLLSGQTA